MKWVYTNPGYKKKYFLCIRSTKNQKIMANFMIHVKKFKIFGKEHLTAYTNFLSVHRKLRNKRLAQVVIQEALRVSRQDGIQVSFYHSARCQPTPFMAIRSNLRLINTNKLIDVRYTSLPKGMTRQEFAKKYELPKKDRISLIGNLRLMEQKDVKEVLRLYNV
jgi:glycylpeptide N-tetradecanoyltransferase